MRKRRRTETNRQKIERLERIIQLQRHQLERLYHQLTERQVNESFAAENRMNDAIKKRQGEWR